VAGATMRCFHNSRGRPRTSADSTARSGRDRHGRPTWRRNTATSWRSTCSSAIIADSPRTTLRQPANTRTAVRYNSRTTMPAILPTNRKTPAHARCEQFWHGTGRHNAGPIASSPDTVDPVCGMPVSPDTAAARRVNDEGTFYLSCHCAAAFDVDSARYTAGAVKDPH